MDNRTKKEKLEAMANQIVSPNEAEIARKKLGQDKPKLVATTIWFDHLDFKYIWKDQFGIKHEFKILLTKSPDNEFSGEVPSNMGEVIFASGMWYNNKTN